MNLYGFGPIRDHLGSRQPCPPAARPPVRQLQPGPQPAGPVGCDLGACRDPGGGIDIARAGSVSTRTRRRLCGLCGLEGVCLLNIQY